MKRKLTLVFMLVAVVCLVLSQKNEIFVKRGMDGQIVAAFEYIDGAHERELTPYEAEELLKSRWNVEVPYQKSLHERMDEANSAALDVDAARRSGVKAATLVGQPVRK